MRSNHTNLVLGLALAAGTATAQTVTVNADINVATTWTSNNTYKLVGQIYVNPGATLTIQAGTVIASDPVDQGSLAVARGAQIFVQGTKDNPVIMTSLADVATWAPLAGHPTGRNPHTGAWRRSALEWGNLTIMGNAFISSCASGNVSTPSPANVAPMEGLIANPAFPTRNLYGGGDDNDDSGTLGYLSLRYGGKVIALTNELNGLSLGGIGRNTDIHHVEIMNNVDDGVEIWGGTVNIKNLAVWNVGDDSVDVDQGWRGKMQYVLVVQGYSLDAPQGSGVGDNCFETDGAEFSDYQPVTTGVVYNATVIGQPNVGGGDHCFTFRDNANMQYRNCVVADIGDRVVRNDNVDGDPCGTGYGFNGTLDFNTRWATPSAVNAPFYLSQNNGNLCEVTDTVFGGSFQANGFDTATIVGAFPPSGTNNNVQQAAIPVTALTREPVGPQGGLPMARVTFLDPRPTGAALTSASFAPNDGFYNQSRFRGAFAPGVNWLNGWTASGSYGITPEDKWCDLGFQTPSTAIGDPVLSGSGSLAPGQTLQLNVTNARPATLGIEVVGFSQVNLPLFGGTLVPLPAANPVFFTDANGNASLPLGPMPAAPFPPGFTIYFQCGIVDANGPQGVTITNAMRIRS